MNSAAKYALLGGLWFTQYLPIGFLFVALPTILRQQGASLEVVGSLMFLMMPWTLKFLWSPMVDLYGIGKFGHYRSWIVPLQILMGLTTAMAALLDLVSDIHLLLSAFFFICLFSATQDIATDALAVRLLEPDERGFGNGLQSAANYAGTISGGLMLLFYNRVGWTTSLLLLAAVSQLPLVAVLSFKEKSGGTVAQSASLRAIGQFFKQRGMWSWLLLAATINFGVTFSNTMFRPFLVDRGVALEEIGLLTGVVWWTAGLVGGLGGGVLISRLGRKRSLVSFNFCSALGLTMLLLPALGWSESFFLYLASVSAGLPTGAAFVAFLTIAMDKSRPATAGTDFTVQVSVLTFGGIVAASASGYVAARFGYAATFVGGAVASLVSAVLVLFFYKESAESRDAEFYESTTAAPGDEALPLP